MTADLRKDDRVFLYPKTKTAPTICYRQAQATVLNKPDGNSYVEVLVDGEDAPRRMHVDNVLRELPASTTKRSTGGRARAELPTGMEEVSLW